MSDDSPDNVIEFKPREPDDGPPMRVQRRSNWCRHDLITVHEDGQRVTCRRCGDELSAHKTLLREAHRQTNAWHTRMRLERENEVLHTKVEVAKKELRSLEAKIKRRQARLAKDR